LIYEGKGREILLKLAKDADVLIENYRPSVKNKLKIDYDTLKETIPAYLLQHIRVRPNRPYSERRF